METISTPDMPIGYRRISWAVAGLMSFIWIGIEDRSSIPMIIVATGLVIAIGLTLYEWAAQRTRPTDRSTLWVATGLGALSGLLVPITTVILMLVKTSLHNHVVPDFSVDDVVAVFFRTPIWVMAGLLIGLALGLIGSIKRSAQM